MLLHVVAEHPNLLVVFPKAIQPGPGSGSYLLREVFSACLLTGQDGNSQYPAPNGAQDQGQGREEPSAARPAEEPGG